jgi:hypothetical protein
MAVSIKAGAQQLWDNIKQALITDALAQSVLSNFGLLQAFSSMSAAPLSDPAANPADAVTTSLAQSSWQEMIPATFTWTPVDPPAFPTGNGQTNDWAASSQHDLGGGEGPLLNGITSADFNKDGNLGLVVANNGTSNVSILPGAGGGTFNNATTVGLNGPDGAKGITSGDFNGDGYPDLVVSNHSSSDLSILLNDRRGGFLPARTISLNGPDDPQGIVSGVFTKDKKLDLAVVDSSGSQSTVSIVLGNGDGTFQSAQTIPLHVQSSSTSIASIATGDFNNGGNLDLVVTNPDDDSLSVLLGNGDGTFQPAQTIKLRTGDNPAGVVVGDLRGDHRSDIVVTNNATHSIAVLLSNGDGSFQAPAYYTTPDSSSILYGVALEQPTAGGPPNVVVTSSNSDTVYVFFNRGNGTFLPAISVPDPGSEPMGITVADFVGNGLEQAAIANQGSSDVVLLSPTGVGNTATFLPGTSTSSTPLSGPTSLQGTVDSVALAKLLTQMQALQGGNTAFLGPFDETSLISGAQKPNVPNFMAFTSLVYSPNQVPLSMNAPGMFLSLTPATLNETANTGAISYTQNGAYLAGWQLLDSNSNPIAPQTLFQLFGTPSPDPTGRPVGVNLTPVNPNQPFTAYNGGWYYDAQPVNGAATTWADAFFDWGLGTRGYSPRNLIPSAPLIGTLPNTATPNVTDSNINYNVSFQPAVDSPLAILGGVPVSLGSSYNQMGIVNDGTIFSSQGIGAGFALSGTLLGGVPLDDAQQGPLRSVIANGIQFDLGPLGSNNVVSAAGQVIPLPAGQFSTLNLLGTAVFGDQKNLEFRLNLSDGTSLGYTQSLSDWTNPATLPGETTAAKMVYRDFKDGNTDNTPVKLSVWSFPLDPNNHVQSITLPNNADAMVLAITLT